MKAWLIPCVADPHGSYLAKIGLGANSRIRETLLQTCFSNFENSSRNVFSDAAGK